MFIELGKRLINLDHVREIVQQPDDDGRQKVRVVYTDGADDRFTCSWRYLERRLKGSLIPAPAGWQVAYVVYEGPGDKGAFRFDLLPVVAFKGDGDMVEAVGLETWPSNRQATVSPDGRVFEWAEGGLNDYASLDAWRKEIESDVGAEAAA